MGKLKLKSILLTTGFAIVSGALASSACAAEKKQSAPAPKAAAAPMMARPAQPAAAGAHLPGVSGGVHVPGSAEAAHVPGNLSTAHVPSNLSTAHVPSNLSTAHVPSNLSTAHVPSNLSAAHVPGNLSAAHVPGNPSAAHVPGNLSTAHVQNGARAAHMPEHESAENASHREPHAEGRMEAERPNEAGRPGHELHDDHPMVGGGAATAAAVSHEREIAQVQGHRDIRSERDFVHAHENDFHTRDVRQFNEREWAAWHRGRWHDDWHYGRHGWWWDVDGVWYEYPDPVYPYPMVVAPLVVHDEVVMATPLSAAPAFPPLPAPPPGWYRCAAPAGYYPDLAACPAGWTRTQEAPPLSGNVTTTAQ